MQGSPWGSSSSSSCAFHCRSRPTSDPAADGARIRRHERMHAYMHVNTGPPCWWAAIGHALTCVVRRCVCHFPPESPRRRLRARGNVLSLPVRSLSGPTNNGHAEIVVGRFERREAKLVTASCQMIRSRGRSASPSSISSFGQSKAPGLPLQKKIESRRGHGGVQVDVSMKFHAALMPDCKMTRGYQFGDCDSGYRHGLCSRRHRQQRGEQCTIPRPAEADPLGLMEKL